VICGDSGAGGGEKLALALPCHTAGVESAVLGLPQEHPGHTKSLDSGNAWEAFRHFEAGGVIPEITPLPNGTVAFDWQ
jgi:hypothetical protein